MSYSKKNIFITLLFLYGTFGFVFIPYLIKSQIIIIIEEKTKTLVDIQSVYFNPFSFSLELEGLTLKDEQNKGLVSFSSLDINIEPSSFFYGALHIKTIKLVKPKIFVIHNKDKSINLLNSFTPDTPKKVQKEDANSSLPRVIIDKVEIKKGFIEYKDYTRRELFVFSFKDIGFSLKNIDTADMASTGAKLRFHSSLGDGGFIDFHSKIHSLEPFIVSGSLEFEASKLYTQWKYFKEELNLEVADGKISFEGEYKFNSADLNATTIENLNISLEKLRILPKDGYKDVVNLNLLSVKGIKIKPFMQTLNVEEIALNGLKIQAKRSADKSIDLLSLIKVNTQKDSANDKNNETVKPWNIVLNKITLSDVGVGLNNSLLERKTKNEKLLYFKSFNINYLNIDTQLKSVESQYVFLDGLELYAQRYKDKSFNIENLINVKKDKVDIHSSKEEPYHLALKEFFLSNASFTFRDNSLEKSYTQKIDKLDLHLYNIDSKKNTWLTYTGGLRLNKKGTFSVNGKLRHTPLKQLGKFELKDLSLQFLNPYLKENSYLSISDAKLSFKGKSTYASSLSSPDLHLSGSFNLNSLTINDVREKTPLLFVDRLQTKSITLELFPNRLYIDEVNVNSFYVDALIDENQTINFSKLTKASNQHNEVEKSNQDVFPIKILKVNVASGNAKFSDHSIPIKFTTNIHNIDGVIYEISNIQGDITYVNIAGDVDEYGSTKLEGSIESSNPKSYTDLNLNFQNLDLNSLSGYSASFAGHEIVSGKLYLDLAYDIFDSQLKGSNSIMMKSVVLGKEIEDENVTVLPLGFVLGLLEDSDGVIDIEMPVEGNVDEPDFKYGTLVLKTIGGLITKAVTSPFKFLGAAMGIDAEELEYINFEPGASIITPPQREKLDKLAKMMLKKPKINLKLAVPYDEKFDKTALQMNKLIDLVMLKSGLKNRKEHENAMTTDLLKDIYEEIQNDDSLKLLRSRLEKKYKDEVLERMFHQKLVVLCREMQIVKTQELVALANKRTQNIYDYLSMDKSIEKSRLTKGTLMLMQSDVNEPISLHIQIEIK